MVDQSTALGQDYLFRPQVGQRVRFRKWEVIGGKGSPLVPCAFTHWMKRLCGTTATVKAVLNDGVDLVDFEYEGDTHWSYSRQMLEPADESDEALRIPGIEKVTP